MPEEVRVSVKRHFDFEQWEKTTLNDPEWSAELYKQLLKQFDLQLLNLESEINAGGTDEIHRLSHGIKGLCQNVGFGVLAVLARRIERNYQKPEETKAVFSEVFREWETVRAILKMKLQT